MTPFVPETVADGKVSEALEGLRLALTSVVEFLGAGAGWVGLRTTSGGLTFPTCRGAFSASWLRLPQPQGSVWGVLLGDMPAVLNDLRPWPVLGDPPLCNLLSCPLLQGDRIIGHVALANKPNGFAEPDVAVLQGMAHHLVRLLDRRSVESSTAVELPPLWGRLLDGVAGGALVLDESGTLVHLNATWLDWTGFRAEELLGRHPPFPFWVSQQDLVRAMNTADALPAGALPFRRRDQSLFWCQVETATERWGEHLLTVAFLQRLPAPSDAPPVAHQPKPLASPAPNWLPLLLESGGGIDGWSAEWEDLTGLEARDVEGSRSELVLDWLFPQQHDRERVADCFHCPSPASCQLVLDVATPSGSRPLLCTFCPLRSAGPAAQRRWLLLVDAPGTPGGPRPDGERSPVPEALPPAV
jgi:PAS domain S-box-containing protein